MVMIAMIVRMNATAMIMTTITTMTSKKISRCSLALSSFKGPIKFLLQTGIKTSNLRAYNMEMLSKNSIRNMIH